MRDVPGRAWCGSVSLFALVGALLVLSAPAMAAAPEEPETGTAEPVTNTTAVLHGTVNPKAPVAVAWFFQYKEGGECGGAGASTTPAVPAEGVSEVEAQPAEAMVAGLNPDTKYMFCLVVRNEAEEVTVGKPMSFTTTASGPIVTNEIPMSVNATEATLSAQVDAEGISTTYSVEYGTNEPYASSGQASLPAGEGAVGVLAHVVGLTPNTQYHFRFVADSALGSARGADVTFKTIAAGSPSGLTLPDGRSYELVSPAVGNQEVYVPRGGLENDSALGQGSSDVFTERPFQASPDGSAIAFVDEPTGSGNGTGNQGQNGGDEWLARRTATGWEAIDIQPALTKPQTEYQAFSDDLSLGFIKSSEEDHLTAGVPEKCRDIYARGGGTGASVYHALFTSPDKEEFCGGVSEPIFAGASADGSRLFYQTAAALTPDSIEAEGGGSENLYESVNGETSPVNLLPAAQGGGPDPNATFGGPPSALFGAVFDFSNAVSDSGARVFWTDLNTGIIYARENGTRTIQISAGAEIAQYWTATRDGRYVYYTESEKLFRFDIARFLASAGSEPEALEGAREELAGEDLGHDSARVHGVVGVSDDGSYVYFVAGGVFAQNENGVKERAMRQSCREASEPGETNGEENVGNLEGGGCNLYLLHVGVSTRFIATLAPKDNTLPISGNAGRVIGDWRADLGSRTAEVSPDGQHLMFESRQRLTDYNNGGTSTQEREVEVFVYQAEDGQLFCASCNPTGAPPAVFTERRGGGTSVPPSMMNAAMRRWMNQAGTRVFFDTSQALLPQDTNGTQDVYEWEMEGTGSCKESAEGCIYLLSGGSSRDSSFLVDASASGGDVFFATREPLTPGVGDQKMELYDAHECTQAAPCAQVTALACTGTGCQGVPPAPPSFATPSSATFSGIGNFPSPSPLVVKPKSKSKPSKCKKGSVKKHGKCVRARTKSKKKAKAKKTSAHQRSKS